MPKVIWIDNTQPPTNYVWMKTDLNDKLIGVYEYIKDKWKEIDVDAVFSKQYYTKWDIDFMLKIAKQEILQRIASGSYDITEIVVDSELNSESTNPVSNSVLTEIINSKQDKIQNLEAIREGAMRGNIAYIKPSTGIRKIDLEESLQRALTDVENVADALNVLGEDYYTKEQITDLLSAFIDNAVDNLINYYTKSEIDSKLSDKQDTLVSGENIKTINGQSIVGSGNITLSGDGGVLVIDNVLSDNSENAVQNKVIKAALDTKSEFSGSYNDLTDKPEIKSRKAFKTNWPTSTTLNAFCQAVINDSDAKVGEAYLGSLSCSGLPSGLWIGDTVVEVIGTDNNKVIKLTVTSTEVAPYHWEASYWQGNLYGWRSFELDSNKVTSLSSASTNAQYPSAKLVYDQLVTKQATISDLADIRSGAGLGATAYQKPQTGIPASDLAPGVIPSGITLLELSSDIGTLTSEQLALVQTNNCVIKYTGNTSGLKGLYHKSYDSTEGIDYNKIQETKSNDNVRSYYFTCIKETGEYNFGMNTDARPRVSANNELSAGTSTTSLENLRIGFTNYTINRQRVYSTPTNQVTNPQEGDICLGQSDWGNAVSPTYTEETEGSGSNMYKFTIYDVAQYTTSSRIDALDSGSGELEHGIQSYINANDERVVVDSADRREIICPVGTKTVVAYSVGSESRASASFYPEIVGSDKEYINGQWQDRKYFSGSYNDLTNKPTIPTVPTISTNIQADKASDVKTASPKAVYDEVHPAVASTQPQGGFAPGVVYDLGTLTGTVTFDLAAGVTGKVNAYHWTFDTGSTAPTITWPSGIIWPDGFTPSVDASMHYEVLVRNGYASMLTFSLT